MDTLSSRLHLPSLAIPLLAAVLALLLAACEGDPTPTLSPTATSTPTLTPSPSPSPTPTSTATAATPTPTDTPAGTRTPTPTLPSPALSMEVLSPIDGAGVEIGAVRVLGRTPVDAVVAINGVPVEVNVDGVFQRDLTLEDGINIIEVAAADLSGRTAAESIAVFFISPTAGLPFSLFYPSDGAEVSGRTVTVTGGTRLDAVVGVNGLPVEVNALGIFSTSVSLEEGPNIIEVVATDFQGNVRFQTVAVFSLP